MAKQRRIEQHDEREDEETRAAVALTEAKARVVIRPATRALLWIVVLGIVFYFLIRGTFWVFEALTGVLLVIVLAIFFAYLIAPLVELVRRPFNARGRERVMPRWMAIGVVYVVIFGSVGVAGWVLYPRLNEQMTQLAQQTPSYINAVRNNEAAQRLNKVYQRLPPKTRELIDQKASDSLAAAGEGVYNAAASLLLYVPWLVLVPILAFFFLKDADSFRQSALLMLPQGRLRWRGDELFQDINSTLAAYIRAQLTSCLIIGTICTVSFAIFDVRYALVLGVTAGFLEFIPLLGPVVVAVLAGSVAGFDSGTKAVAVLAFLGVLRIVQDYVLYPRIIGSGIHLHPLAVILAILAGHELAGVAGIFLAIPVIAVLTVTYRHWLEHRGSAGLVADLLRPAETPSAAVGAGEPAEAQPTPLPPSESPAR